MIHLGKYNTLRYARMTAQGAYLEDTEGNEVLLPNKYVTANARQDASLEVFVYNDSEDRPVATTKRAKVTAGKCALLEVKTIVQNLGAFADMGLEKDLLIPFNEQPKRLKEGRQFLVFMYLDEKSGRLVGSTHLHKHLSNEGMKYKEGDKVRIMPWYPSDLGWNVVVDKKYQGLIHTSDVFGELTYGEKIQAFIRTIREDNKLDIVLQRPGVEAIEPNAQRILQKLRDSGGNLPLGDKSSPKEIAVHFQMSKKAFKKAIGGLYKQRLIVMNDNAIKLKRGS